MNRVEEVQQPETAGAAAGDDRWQLVFVLDRENRRVIETLTVMCDGVFGRRGLPIADDERPSSMVLANGVFDDRSVPNLLFGPDAATAVAPTGGQMAAPQRVVLDLRRGIVTSRVGLGRLSVTVEQFASAADEGIHVITATGPVERRDDIVAGIAPTALGVANSGRGAIAAAAERIVTTSGAMCLASRITALAATPPLHAGHAVATAEARLRSALRSDVAALRADHEAMWANRWEKAAFDLPERRETEARLRFAQYHLLASAGRGRESAIGARAATGTAYSGHVFWDTDVFVVPALAAMDPARARAALCYRFRRLAAARKRARSEGHAGARFPWESADTGAEAAPTRGVDLHGRTVEIKTGSEEEHIVADVAWGVMHYLDWTGDDSFARGAATEIMVETARYWQSRIEVDSDGTGHLRGVIGPDEYHETIDDNAFTNGMARWNLQKAADFCSRHRAVTDAEAAAWRATGASLVDGFDASERRHEQFDGYFELDPTMVSGIGTAPLAADVLLGRDRIQRSQIIKQPDVLMLHHLLPYQLPPGSFEPDLAYYLPRTAHGSSLSPAITAALLARAGRLDDAEHWFDIALGLDLDDLSMTTAGGLHLATMGGVWQAVVFGFGGVRPYANALHIDPHVPPDWGALTVRCVFRNRPVVITASADRFTVTSPEPIDIVIGNDCGERPSITTRQLSAQRTDDDWSVR